MKKVLSTAMALGFCLYLPTAVLAGGSTSNDAILRELQELRSQVSNQQAEIEKLKGKKGTSADEMEYLKNKVAANGEHIEAIEAKKGFAVSGNEFINGIKLKGDVRVRYEIDELNYKKSQDDKNESISEPAFVWAVYGIIRPKAGRLPLVWPLVVIVPQALMILGVNLSPLKPATSALTMPMPNTNGMISVWPWARWKFLTHGHQFFLIPMCALPV